MSDVGEAHGSIAVSECVHGGPTCESPPHSVSEEVALLAAIRWQQLSSPGRARVSCARAHTNARSLEERSCVRDQRYSRACRLLWQCAVAVRTTGQPSALSGAPLLAHMRLLVCRSAV